MNVFELRGLLEMLPMTWKTVVRVGDLTFEISSAVSEERPELSKCRVVLNTGKVRSKGEAEVTSSVLADLQEVRKAVFGDVGDSPNVYANYDEASRLSGLFQRAIHNLRYTRPEVTSDLRDLTRHMLRLWEETGGNSDRFLASLLALSVAAGYSLRLEDVAARTPARLGERRAGIVAAEPEVTSDTEAPNPTTLPGAIAMIDAYKNALIDPVEMLRWTWLRVILLKLNDHVWDDAVDRAEGVISG